MKSKIKVKYTITGDNDELYRMVSRAHKDAKLEYECFLDDLVGIISIGHGSKKGV